MKAGKGERAVSKIHILVADNDCHYRESLLEDVLKPEGYVVFQAGSPGRPDRCSVKRN